MDDYTGEEVREARAPVASLLSKSEKARQKVAPGTWQHTMLEGDIRALQIALPLIGDSNDDSDGLAPDDLDSALRALDSMIERVANTEAKFAPGTSRHSLQRNRLKALRIARTAVMAKLSED